MCWVEEGAYFVEVHVHIHFISGGLLAGVGGVVFMNYDRVYNIVLFPITISAFSAVKYVSYQGFYEILRDPYL